MRESQQLGRMRLQALMGYTKESGAEMAEERGRFSRLAGDESKTRAVSSFNLFQTPEALADMAVSHLGREGRMLEPSAGLGRLYRAYRKVSACHVTLVEVSSELCGELYRSTEADADCKLVQADFLACTPERLGLFDCVVMNPPFKNGADIKHILHAKTFLAPGGRLVSICAGGNRRRSALEPIATEWIDLPPGSFKTEATGVDTAIVIIDN